MRYTLILALSYGAAAQSTADAFVVKIPGAGMTSSVSLAMSNGTAGPGQTVQIPISLTSFGTAAPSAFQADLNFDAQKLTFASASAGSQLTAANKTISSSVLANGAVRLLTSGMNQTVIAGGVAAYVSFKLNGDFVSGNAALMLSNCASSSTGGSSLPTNCSAGTVTAFSCDLNADGAVNVADVQLIVNEMLGVIPAVHDLNHDGLVNIVDVQKEINAAMGAGCVY